MNKTNKEKIAIFCPTMQGGGIERVVSELAKHFNERYNIQIVIIRDNGQRYILPSPPIQLVRTQFGNGKLSTYALLMVSTIRYIHYLWKEKPGISLSMGGSANLVNMVACLFSNTVCLTSFHSNPSRKNDTRKNTLKRYLQNTLYKYQAWISKYILSTSEGIRNTLIEDLKFDPEKVITIYNPINISEISRKKNETLLDDFFDTNLPIIISVGWLYHIKGQWHLIRVFSKILKHVQCRLVICGVGFPSGFSSSGEDYTEKYHLLVSKLGLEDKVYFAGWQENPYKYMKNATVFVHPSLSESFSNVVAEALACGVPVVASDCDFGPREILDNGEYGLLCTCSEWEYLETEPLTDAEQDMMDKILLLLTDEELRTEYALKGIERVKEFDTNKSMEKYGELFQKVIKP